LHKAYGWLNSLGYYVCVAGWAMVRALEIGNEAMRELGDSLDAVKITIDFSKN